MPERKAANHKREYSSMNTESEFEAPWANSLKWMTLFSVVILAGVALIGLTSGPRESIIWISAMVLGPLAILAGSACFIIRGYVLTPNELIVKRAGWNTRIDLRDLQSTEIDPDAMAKSIRLFGNGGLFCFAGLFRNKKLGSYRVFATDPVRAVVLRFTNRTVVVTPHDPENFSAILSRR